MRKIINKKVETSFILSKEEEKMLLEKITLALKQAEDGDFLTEEEMDKEIDSWD